MSKVFHSRVYGAMTKRRRRELGLKRFRREAIWRRMAAEEQRITDAARWRPIPWWRRALRWLLAALRLAR